MAGGIIKTIGRNLSYVFFFLYNRLSRSSSKCILFIPHENSGKDGYDILNPHSDNVLCLFNYVLGCEFYKEYKLYLLVDNIARNPYYEAFCRDNGRGAKVTFIKRSYHSLEYCKAFSNSAIIFITHMFLPFPYKKRKQKIICLGYFTPFKNDFIWTDKEYDRIAKNNNKFYSYHISTSDLASRILSSDNGLHYSHFVPLGMSRNDIFYDYKGNKNVEIVKSLYSEYSKIILYTPTFRDYEDNKKSDKRSILGYADSILPLQELLQKFNAILIIKLHPLQNKAAIENLHADNIVTYDTSQNRYSLYDLMCITDILITDYTSTYFDFLHLDRPILFNFYDKDTYIHSRGFAFSEIEQCCAGPIVGTFEGFVNCLKDFLEGKDNYKQVREKMNALFNLYHDGRTSERICDYFIDK